MARIENIYGEPLRPSLRSGFPISKNEFLWLANSPLLVADIAPEAFGFDQTTAADDIEINGLSIPEGQPFMLLISGRGMNTLGGTYTIRMGLKINATVIDQATSGQDILTLTWGGSAPAGAYIDFGLVAMLSGYVSGKINKAAWINGSYYSSSVHGTFTPSYRLHRTAAMPSGDVTSITLRSLETPGSAGYLQYDRVTVIDWGYHVED